MGSLNSDPPPAGFPMSPPLDRPKPGRLAVCCAVGLVLWFMPVPSGLQSEIERSLLPATLPAEVSAQLQDGVRESISESLKDGGLEESARQRALERIHAGADSAFETHITAQRAWRLFAVFLAVIAGFLLRPMAMGPVVIVGMVVLMFTQTLDAKQMMAGYGDRTTWLIVAAFLIAGSVLETGFGRRLSLLLVRSLGRSTLGLGYALCGAELILGPAIPSNTARGGGLLAPITRSLAEALGSSPARNPKLAGAYLSLVGAHACIVSSAMYLTAMSANSLVTEAARNILDVEFGWGTWLLGSCVPGLVAMALIPPLFYWLEPPELKDARHAQQEAARQLVEMGSWSWPERILGCVLLTMMVLWATGPMHGLHTTAVAWMGVAVLIVSGAERWENMTKNAAAWDVLIWLGGLLAMAAALKEYHFIGWLAAEMQTWVEGLNGIAVALVLTLIYLYSMYCFSMMTAHIAAMVGAFFTVAALAGAPPKLIVPLLAYFSCLCAVVTNYSTGPVIIYFGQGYVPAPRWFVLGLLMSFFHLAIWLILGMGWWKVLGWW